ncbi:zinc knuckle CX2CX4HX4C containing protein [Tanacetum coccineum]
MEAGFLNVKNVSNKSSLAAKVKNIKGKLLGKDANPLKSCLKKVNSKTIQDKPVGEVSTHGVDAVTKVNLNANNTKVSILATHITETVLDADENNNIDLGLKSDGTNKDGSRLKQDIPKKFSSQDGMVKTLEGGPWFIRSMPIVLNKWSANTKLKREEIPRVPVWVKIHNVLIVAFSETGLSLITTQLGRPMMSDASTSDMCINPWGRNSYARVLVELSSECAVKESIVVVIPLPKGEGHYLEELDVEYEWWPPRCSKCKIFDHEDEGCPSRVKKTSSYSLLRESGVCNAGIQHKKKGMNKATKKQGFWFTKPKNNLIYMPVSKSSTMNENNSKPNANTPPISKEDVNGAAIEPNVSHKVTMNDSSCSTNENGYFKDDIDLGQLRSNFDKLMDEEKVLELDTNYVTKGVSDTVNSIPNTSEVSTNSNSVPMEVKEKNKGSLLEQFLKSCDASTSKHNSMSDSDKSDVEEVCMSDVILGGGFLDGFEDDLDCYEAHL